MSPSSVSPRIVSEIEDSHYSGRLSVSLGSCLDVLVLEWLAPETICFKYIYPHSGTLISRGAGLLNQINAPSDLGHVLVAQSSKDKERILIVRVSGITRRTPKRNPHHNNLQTRVFCTFMFLKNIG
jgi:hypothetical protein